MLRFPTTLYTSYVKSNSENVKYAWEQSSFINSSGMKYSGIGKILIHTDIAKTAM